MAQPASVPELTPVLVVDQKAELGEGPFWDARRHQLLWLDILGAQVFSYDPASKANIAYDLSKHTQHVTTIVPVQGCKSTVVVGTTEGIAKLDLEQGETSFEAHSANGTLHGEYVRMNDGKCDPQGRLWIGSIAREGPGGADLVTVGAALYVYEGWQGEPSKALEKVTVSNGICWSADGSVMFYTDSPTCVVDAFDFNGAAESHVGLISNRRRALRVSDGFPPVPDGNAIDCEGMLWIACFGAGEVRRYNPVTGELLATVRLPKEAGPQTTACAFGGVELDELYITTAHEFWDTEQMSAMPLAGGLFKVPRDELAKLGDVRGMPGHCFKM
eukprot:TRINITY_DN21130_c0_g2_i1.p1 TRINITY_DN21130_c0_g2~~TRINITY_DN21130_c0_g2_i1.p1  ORF type:complete len:330 (-),score=33.99 TRINITY_DN21130_c0_g2_i1:49-1038(-)